MGGGAGVNQELQRQGQAHVTRHQGTNRSQGAAGAVAADGKAGRVQAQGGALGV